ncbi:transposase, partial [[Flexibacter] sp. ATCC 35208]
PQTGRWQVERSFAWLNFFRRLDKDHERLPESSVAFIQVAFINIPLK